MKLASGQNYTEIAFNDFMDLANACLETSSIFSLQIFLIMLLLLISDWYPSNSIHPSNYMQMCVCVCVRVYKLLNIYETHIPLIFKWSDLDNVLTVTPSKEQT